jgi:hypothetical protein
VKDFNPVQRSRGQRQIHVVMTALGIVHPKTIHQDQSLVRTMSRGWRYRLEHECRGVNCYEALAISEVFHLCERPEVSLVVIDASVDDERAKAVQKRFPTLRLDDGATVEDATWELTNLLDKGSAIE